MKATIKKVIALPLLCCAGCMHEVQSTATSYCLGNPYYRANILGEGNGCLQDPTALICTYCYDSIPDAWVSSDYDESVLHAIGRETERVECEKLASFLKAARTVGRSPLSNDEDAYASFSFWFANRHPVVITISRANYQRLQEQFQNDGTACDSMLRPLRTIYSGRGITRRESVYNHQQWINERRCAQIFALLDSGCVEYRGPIEPVPPPVADEERCVALVGPIGGVCKKPRIFASNSKVLAYAALALGLGVLEGREVIASEDLILESAQEAVAWHRNDDAGKRKPVYVILQDGHRPLLIKAQLRRVPLRTNESFVQAPEKF